MKMLASLRSLFRHMEWADAAVWRAVFSTGPARSDAKVKTRLHHTHLVQRSFLRAWAGQPFEPGAGGSLDLAALARWGREYHGDVSGYLAGLTEAALDGRFVVPWARMVAAQFDRELSAPSLGETLLQVTAHSTYHRGQVNARLRELGGEPSLVDFIMWVWLGKPAPEWPEEAAAAT